MTDPVADVVEEMTLAGLDARTGHMLEQVLETVTAERSIATAANDALHHALQYAAVRKRHMAQGIGAAALAGVGTPLFIGSAVALAGQVLTWAGSEALQKVRIMLKTQAHRVSKIRITKEQPWQGADKTCFTAQVVDPAYRQQLFDEVRYILEHQGLTDLFNAFDDLERDYDEIKASQLVQGVPPGEALSGQQHPPEVKIGNCSDALRLLEIVCRVRRRYSRLADAADLLDEFLTYTTLVVSQFDADGVPTTRRLWEAVIEPHKQRIAAAASADELLGVAHELLKVFAQAARQAGLSGRPESVMKVLFRPSHGGSEGYDPKAGYDRLIIEKLMPALAHAASPQLQVAHTVLAQRILARAKQFDLHDAKVCGKAVLMLAEEFAGMSPVMKVHPDKKLSPFWKVIANGLQGALVKENAEELVGILMERGCDAVLGVLEELAKRSVGHVAPTPLGRAAVEGAFGTFFKPGDAISSAAGTVVGLLVELGNSTWNEYKFETRQTLGITGRRAQSLSERVATLRTLGKGEIGDYADVMEAWEAVHQEIPTGKLDPVRAAALLLRYKDCERRYYDNRCGWLLQEVVAYAWRELRWVARSLLCEVLTQTDAYMARTDAGHGTPCKPICYCRSQGIRLKADQDDCAAPRFSSTPL